MARRKLIRKSDVKAVQRSGLFSAIAVIVLCAALWGVACPGAEQTAATVAASPADLAVAAIDVTADALSESVGYPYQGQALRISGAVARVDVVSGDVSVTFATSNKFKPIVAGIVSEQRDRGRALRPHDKVTLRCVGGRHLFMGNCRFD